MPPVQRAGAPAQSFAAKRQASQALVETDGLPDADPDRPTDSRARTGPAATGIRLPIAGIGFAAQVLSRLEPAPALRCVGVASRFA